jgi:dTDP-4-dehydrorhamnose 3,5-epimerase
MSAETPESSLSLDHTAAVARRDEATVRSDGSSLASVIDGVVTVAPINHVDHRGRVFEVFNGQGAMWAKPVVYCYAFTVRHGTTKGWGLHEHKDDRYTLISGEVLTVLHDARVDSPTHGLTQRVTLSGQGIRQLLIPAGVWHVNINLGEAEAHLVNHPTEVYVHGQPDRLLLPWDSPEIPADLEAYFPNQYKSPAS